MIPQTLQRTKDWCVSKDKVPLDLFALERGYEWGASNKRSHSSYEDYNKAKEIGLKHKLPITLMVDSEKLNIYVIDIEKTCPEEIRQGILNALKQNITYIETSLSGKGFHLVVGLNAPQMLKTAKYKKWFEILTNHHCTFTENELSFDDAFNYQIDTNEYITDDEKDVELLNALSTSLSPIEFYDLIGDSKVNLNTANSDEFDDFKRVAATFDGRHADLFNILCDVDYTKTVDGDFFGDYSRYEFGYASKLTYAAKRISEDMIDNRLNHYDLKLTREQHIMIVFMVLKQSLPYRAKHDEFRNGLPWLLYTAQQVYDKTFS